MKPGFLQTKYQNDEDRRIASILVKIIYAMLAAYLMIFATGFFWGDPGIFVIIFAGGLALSVPWALLARGSLRLSGICVVIVVLLTITVAATEGNGIHDLAIVGYPVVIVIASLLMQRRDFLWLSFLTVVAMAWLIFGEAFGLFVSRTYAIPGPIDFTFVAAVMGVAILAVDMLAEHMRENIRTAHQEIGQRKTMEAQIRHQSIHDALTGIYNRAFFEEELKRLEGGGEYPVSIIVADIDNLKVVNDTQGHVAGDEFLRRTTSALRSVFRSGDVLARIGGDEFAILLPSTDSAKVDQMLARVHAKLTEHNSGYPYSPVELSLGASTAEQGKLTEAFIAADQRMYANKGFRKSKAKD